MAAKPAIAATVKAIGEANTAKPDAIDEIAKTTGPIAAAIPASIMINLCEGASKPLKRSANRVKPSVIRLTVC